MILTQPHSASKYSLIGASPAMSTLRQDIAAAARTAAKVLVLGETGVGKEVVARLIHEQSARAHRPFVAVNCSGIPETLLESELFGHVRGSFTGAHRDKAGLVQQAHHGTLFLDELGEMSLRMQAALLRFTETGEVQQVGADSPRGRVDVRLVCATNRDLRAAIADGQFREDLYYRLNVIQIVIPPLRERGEDVLQLLDHYLELAARTHAMRKPVLDADSAQMLLAYPWPGNVRELRNVTERLVLLQRDRPLGVRDLPQELLRPSPVSTLRPTAPAVSVAAAPAPAAAPPVPPVSPLVEGLWSRLMAGEDFWTVVQAAFKQRQIARADLASLIDRGLTETHGSYRALVKLFNLPPTDYHRFHAFLYGQQCNLPVQPYRVARRVKVWRVARGASAARDEALTRR